MRDIIASMRGRIFILKMKLLRKNIHIGKGLKIYKKLHIGGKGRVQIGEDCLVDGIIGDSSQYVCIDAVNPDSVVIIGDHARLYAARMYALFSIEIGDNVFIEEAAITDTSFHSIDRDRGTPIDESKENSKVKVGDRVLMGCRSVVTRGVTLSDDVCVAPGAVVTKSIPTGHLVMGNPAKILQ